MIDFRSDTVTTPTPAMREAIAQAEVGDDVFGDDPTVKKLEARTAELLGKEAAVYTPSGTMANQMAVRTHTNHGDEIIIEATAHVYLYESGATAALSGAICRTVQGKRGIFTAKQVEAVLRPKNEHYATARLICLENTHNQGGGRVWPIERMAEIAALARQRDLRIHLDGARLWNASAASGIPEHEYAAHFDSVSVCFSKGLGAPVGSALVGSQSFIEEARRFRKQFGGSMRQSGIIAAGALYALKHHRKRLTEDHANARLLAEGLAAIDGIELDPDTIETNIVRFATAMPASELVEKAQAVGVGILAIGPNGIRAVTNLHVSADDVRKALEIIRKVTEQN